MNSFRNEITRDNLKWNYEHPDIFYLPQWQTGSKVDTFYMVYKILLAVFYFVVFFILCYAGHHIPFVIRIKAACYYTFWIFFICTIYAILSLISVSVQYWKQRRKHRENGEVEVNSLFYKIQWITQSIALDSSIAVSLGYFSLEFFYQLKPFGAGTSVMHLWNTLLIFMDLFISSIPVKLIHIYPSVILGFFYGIFSYVYFLSGGLGIYGRHYLYKIMDYKNRPAAAAFAWLAVLAYMIFGRILVYYSYKLRKKLYDQYYLSTATDDITRHISVAK